MVSSQTTIKQFENISVEEINNIGSKIASYLKKIKIRTAFDLILHLPSNYQNKTQVIPIANLSIGLNQTVQATLISINIVKSIANIYASDGTGTIKITCFNYNPFVFKNITVNKSFYIYGKVTIFNNQIQMTNPEFYTLLPNSYSASYKLTSSIKMNQMRKYIKDSIKLLMNYPLPELIPSNLNLYSISLSDAIKYLHEPSTKIDLNDLQNFNTDYHKRILIEELIAYNLSLLKIKNKLDNVEGIKISYKKRIHEQLISSLSFQPTNSQHSVFKEIIEDLSSKKPMNRLVQGDVGCGKTLVATMAILQVLANKKQVALLVPTEILAQQHYENIKKFFSSFDYSIELLVGKLTNSQKTKITDKISKGECQLVIGTHAIFQDNVTFNNLALVVIDEQHRFGVEQRMLLKNKCSSKKIPPHILSLTATPIPRTLAQTMYMDVKLSIINELPPGRKPVKTILISETNKYKLLPRIMEHCKLKKQVFWVCSLITENDSMDCQDAINTANYLSTNLPKLKVSMIHGKVKEKDKQQIMEQFKNGEIDILVATSVIEVGVDVPNAFLIVIENAERFGLAQLHQLRGRVGRGCEESFCCLICNDNITQESLQRMNILRETNDGFVIAQKDLEIRGPGDIIGTKQTGDMEFKVVNINRDKHLIPICNSISQEIFNKYPNIVDDIINRWFPNSKQNINN